MRINLIILTWSDHPNIIPPAATTSYCAANVAIQMSSRVTWPRCTFHEDHYVMPMSSSYPVHDKHSPSDRYVASESSKWEWLTRKCKVLCHLQFCRQTVVITAPWFSRRPVNHWKGSEKRGCLTGSEQWPPVQGSGARRWASQRNGSCFLDSYVVFICCAQYPSLRKYEGYLF